MPEKYTRGVAKGVFTRARKGLMSLIQKGADDSVTLAARNPLVQCYFKLEEAHINNIMAAQIDIEESQEDTNYLDQPHQELTDALFMYGEFLERKEKFNSDAMVLEDCIFNFGSPAKNVSKLIKDGIMFADMRIEIKRIEEMMQRLIERKNNLVSNSSGFTGCDLEGLQTRLRKEVIKEAEKAKAIALQFLKESDYVLPTSGAAGTGGRASHSSNTKKEAVQLPKFASDKKGGQAFLKNPIWLKNWNAQIIDYEEKYRASMLLSNIDNEDQKKIIGIDNKYVKAMDKLDKYYGDLTIRGSCP